MKLSVRRRGLVGLRSKLAIVGFGVILGMVSTHAQTPPGEHASHHPDPTQQTPGVSPAGAGGMGQAKGAMGGEMGRMMQQMGTPPPKELYPSLMSLPDLPAEKRAEIERQAHDRMIGGMKVLSDALERMTPAAEREDYATLQDAAEQMRQGMAQYESGLAAHRALVEGKAPRNVALQWFKREMNLLPLAAVESPHGIFGLSWFHYFVMFILLASGAAMIWMYYHRMRRADYLLASLAAGKSELAARPVAAAPAAVPRPGLAAGAPPITPETTAPPGAIPAGRWSGQLRVAKIFQETPDVRTFRLVHPAGSDLPFGFEPGQFLTVSVNIDGKEAKRSYSIASSPCRRTWCEITVKHSPGGLVSGYLHERVRGGDLIGVSGPFGKFTFRGQEATSVVLIAGGVGITPLMSAVRCLTDQAWTGEIFLLYACATAQDVIFREELEYLVRRYPNFQLTIVLSKETSPDWKGPRGHITKDLLLQTVPNLSARRVHLCGPPPMMEAGKAILAEAGVPADQVRTENFLGAEPRPAPPAGTPIVAAPAQVAAMTTCAFVRSGKTAPLPPDRTVLDVSEDVGVNIDYSCREGYCGVCKTKVLRGRVTMAVEDALTPEDKAANIILACQAKSKENIEVDA